MEAFAIYLLKSASWLTGFALVYLLFLRNERFFVLKRAYLIAGMVFSIVFPFISFHYQVELPANELSNADLIQPDVPVSASVQQFAAGSFDYRTILLFLYLSGAVFLIFKMIRHIMVLYNTINKVSIYNNGPAKLVRVSGFPASFTFFNYVFIDPSLGEAEVEEIMNHELVHVKQKHWFDLLLVEILRLVQWVNPFAWIYTGFIRQNHEYLADETALRNTSDPANYRAALVNQLFNSPVISLSNSLNYSLNKRRFEMMKKIITSPYRKLKVLFIIPVFAIVFYAFATPEYHYAVPSGNSLTISQASVINVREVKGKVLKEDGTPFEGVQIVVTGSSVRVSSDATGNFTIENVPEDALLVFSYVGYKTQVVKALFAEEMTVKLQKDPDYKEQVEVRKAASLSSQFRRKNPEDYPTFRGDGINGFRIWVQGKIEYPAEAKARNLEGLVHVNFIVEPDGTVSNVRLTGAADPVLGEEVVRVVKSSPRWEPAKNPEANYPYELSLILSFVLPDQILRNEPYVVVEQMPQYPGGEKELLKFIAQNTQYPELAKAGNIEGKVILRFVVNTEGNTEDISVLKSVHPVLDAEAARVVGMLKGFVPGHQNGKAVDVYYKVPITFALRSRFPDVKQQPLASSVEEPVADGIKSTKDIIVIGFKDSPSAARPLRIVNASDRSLANTLVIVDGRQGDRKLLETIDPSDIESISVLKGGSATNVYGEKGKNGVIIVTKKKKVSLVP